MSEALHSVLCLEVWVLWYAVYKGCFGDVCTLSILPFSSSPFPLPTLPSPFRPHLPALFLSLSPPSSSLPFPLHSAVLSQEVPLLGRPLLEPTDSHLQHTHMRQDEAGGGTGKGTPQ